MCKCIQNMKIGLSGIKHKIINDVVINLVTKMLICILSCFILFHLNKRVNSHMVPPSITNKNSSVSTSSFPVEYFIPYSFHGTSRNIFERNRNAS